VLNATLRTTRAEQEDHRLFQPGGPGLGRGLHVIGRGGAFGDAFQRDVVPGLRADVQQPQPQSTQTL
jgi:hypothetical protein